MFSSNNAFSPDNVFSELAWNAVLQHVKKQNIRNIMGLYNCKIFYSTYISLVSSYTNISNTEVVESNLESGLNSFFTWAKINENRFKTDTENFVYYDSFFSINPYIKHLSRIFYSEIKGFNSDYYFYNHKPNFMIFFEIDRPMSEEVIYDEDYFFDLEMEYSRIDEFFDVIKSNLIYINDVYDSIISDPKNNYLLPSQNINPSKMIGDNNFFNNLVIKPFCEDRCQICGNFFNREELKLEKVYGEGLIMPMCNSCSRNNLIAF